MLEVDFPFSSAKLRWRLEAHNLIEIGLEDTKVIRPLLATSTNSAVVAEIGLKLVSVYRPLASV